MSSMICIKVMLMFLRVEYTLLKTLKACIYVMRLRDKNSNIITNE